MRLTHPRWWQNGVCSALVASEIGVKIPGAYKSLHVMNMQEDTRLAFR
jgi:hypothetical protein